MQLADISQPTWGPSRNPETDAGQLRKTYERRRLLVRVCSTNASVAVAFLLAVLPTAFFVRLICNFHPCANLDECGNFSPAATSWKNKVCSSCFQSFLT
ncbi:hypothetical protein V2G26_016078 [Clonostachys chloroleuca]